MNAQKMTFEVMVNDENDATAPKAAEEVAPSTPPSMGETNPADSPPSNQMELTQSGSSTEVNLGAQMRTPALHTPLAEPIYANSPALSCPSTSGNCPG